MIGDAPSPILYDIDDRISSSHDGIYDEWPQSKIGELNRVVKDVFSLSND